MRLRENIGFPAVILVLQNANVILLFSSIIAGSIWANSAFGRSWEWDPKETWSLILFSTGIIAYTYTALRAPGVVFQILISTVYLALFIFGVFVVPYLLPGPWPGFLLSR
jgi:ABC-type transport system involved in cytochrome c biogenesis permease subunit